MPIRHERGALLLGIDSILDILGILRCRDERQIPKVAGTDFFADAQTTCHLETFTCEYRCFIVPTRSDTSVLLHLLQYYASKSCTANSIWKSPRFVRLPRRIAREREFNLVAITTRWCAQRSVVSSERVSILLHQNSSTSAEASRESRVIQIYSRDRAPLIPEFQVIGAKREASREDKEGNENRAELPRLWGIFGGVIRPRETFLITLARGRPYLLKTYLLSNTNASPSWSPSEFLRPAANLSFFFRQLHAHCRDPPAVRRSIRQLIAASFAGTKSFTPAATSPTWTSRSTSRWGGRLFFTRSTSSSPAWEYRFSRSLRSICPAIAARR